MKRFATAIVFCLLSSGACSWAQSAESILGTWTTQHRLYTPHNGIGGRAFGVSIATFRPDGTFKLDLLLDNGRMVSVGRYRFDGHSLYYVLDDYEPKGIGLDPGPAYHHPCTEPVEFDDVHNQMHLNGNVWNHQSR
jgi:hypothetical protein